MLKSYRDLIVWQKSIDLVIEVYRVTDKFPKSEIYGLTSQMRRAAVSVPSNIAEGYYRKHRPEYLQFLRVAFGSGAELETQIVIAKRLELIPIAGFTRIEELLSDVMRMLNKMIDSLSAKP